MDGPWKSKAWLGGALFVIGCSGRTVQSEAARGTEQQEGGTAGSGAAGGRNIGGSNPIDPTTLTLTLTPDGYPRCGALDPNRANSCDKLELIRPVSPRVSIFDDGSILVGEQGGISVFVKNDDVVDHDDVCVGVRVNLPGIDLQTEGQRTNPARVGRVTPNFDAYGEPCTMFVRDPQPGKVATFTFWTTYAGTNCTGPTLSVDALVKTHQL